MILIISEEKDQSTADVIDWISFYGHEFLRINDTDEISGIHIITLSGSGGSSADGYTYRLFMQHTSDRFTSDDGDFTGLKAGNYRAYVANDNSCGDEYRWPSYVEVSQPSRMRMTPHVEEITCYLEDDGAITAAVTGGNGGYSYQWEFYDSLSNEWIDYNINGEGTGTTLTNLFPTAYRLEVTDSETCKRLFAPVVMNEPAPVEIRQVEIVNPLCNGGMGTFYPEITGGTGGYTTEYSVDEIDWHPFSPGDLLPIGTYYLRTEDENHCATTYEDPIEIAEPEPVAINIAPKNYNGYNVTCHNSSDGIVTLHASGGASEYEYALDTGDFQASNEFPGLQAGVSYIFHVRDTSGCMATDTVELTQPTSLGALVASTDPPLCYGEANGRVTINGLGGAGGYTYSADSLNFSDNPTVSGYAYGRNYFYVRDGNGCTIKRSFILNQPELLEVSVASKEALTCYENNSGQVTLQAQGGIPPYEFAVDSLQYQTEPDFSGLRAGEQVIYVRDSNGCIAEGTVTLTQPTPVELVVTQQNKVKCFGFNTGFVEVEASGGTGGYEYSIDEVNYSNDQRFEGLTAQTYTLYAKDANGCLGSVTTTIESLEPVLLDLEPIDVSCYNYSNGEIIATVEGGTAPYTYDWKETNQTGNHVTGLPKGEYNVEVTDSEGCIAIGSTTLVQPDNIDLGEAVSICQDQTYPLDATHPEGATYEWASANGFTGSGPVAYFTEAGTYELTLTLDDGCVMTDEVEVTQSDVKFEVNFLGATEAVLGDTLRMIEVCYPAPETIEWDFGPAEVIAADDHRPQISFDEPGAYTITLTAGYSGCIDSLSKQVVFFTTEDKPDNHGRLALGEAGIKAVELYPNPNDGRFTVMVYLHQPEDLMVVLYDIFGQEITRKKKVEDARYRLDFDVKGVKNGVYVLQLMTATASKELRILIK